MKKVLLAIIILFCGRLTVFGQVKQIEKEIPGTYYYKVTDSEGGKLILKFKKIVNTLKLLISLGVEF